MAGQEQMKWQYIEDKHICCPSCSAHDFTDIRQFNLMFKTFQGVTGRMLRILFLSRDCSGYYFCKLQECTENFQKESSIWYQTDRKSFRNEITPGNFTFRTREFEQMELNFFCKPGTDLKVVCLLETVLH